MSSAPTQKGALFSSIAHMKFKAAGSRDDIRSRVEVTGVHYLAGKEMRRQHCLNLEFGGPGQRAGRVRLSEEVGSGAQRIS
jgi:hypothetical protein